MMLRDTQPGLSGDFVFVAGLDEAGRGPLAGPVTAGCVILPPDFPVELLNDSKKLSEKKREKVEPVIKEMGCWGLGIVDHKEIDRINILQASMKAMGLAFEDMLKKLPSWCEKKGLAVPDSRTISAICDGNKCPDIDCDIRCEVKADAKYPSVMAASIIAKVARDKIMVEYDALYPQYGYARHKGYPTEAHRKICRELGPSPIQRLTFTY